MSTKKSSIRNVPKTEDDFIVLGRNVLHVWKTRPEFTLNWTDPDRFENAVELFESSFSLRRKAKGNRSVITITLLELNREINRNIRFVKDYLIELYTRKEAPAYYPLFGIVRKNKSFSFPKDNDRRLFALQQLVVSIKAPDFNGKRYGYVYWRDVLERFEKTKTLALESDSDTSQHVNSKNGQKAIIRQTLNALIFLIKANYPLQWREELRIWGFQKEKY
jgi:hypothetical protein